MTSHIEAPLAPADPLHTGCPSGSETSLDVLRRNARTFRIMCQCFGLDCSFELLERVAAIYDRKPGWVTAQALPTDLLILYLAARGLRPRRVVEIGVASGLSTCALLAGLADAGVPAVHADGLATVQSFDILEHVPWDTQRPIGSVIRELVPECSPAVRLNTGRTSMDLESMLGDTPVDLAFIDGAHNHPWPLIDAIQLCRVMAPGAWIILHDVALVERAIVEAFARRMPELGYIPTRGAEWLFEMWPSAKVRGSESGHNVGLVRALPLDELRLHPNLCALAALPWECAPPEPAEAVLRSMCGDEMVERGSLLGRPGADLLAE